MSAIGRRRRRITLALVITVLTLTPALSQLDLHFMPKGGKTLLIELLGEAPNAADVRAILAARRDEAQWRDIIAARVNAPKDRALATLVAYLAVNMPVSGDTPLTAADLAAALPRDGRELAWNECQFCHSLFTSHLAQDRDVRAWLNMFQSPFHRELKMTPQERLEFARYSAINMPMRIEDVPPDLRF